jgi:L-lactate dehydrogenase complex protein LldF
VYGGPIGSVLTPQMVGVEDGGELPFVSTLCGACAEECPVKIDMPHQLVHMRHKAVATADAAPRMQRQAFALWAKAMSSQKAYRSAVALARIAGTLANLFPWLGGPLRAWSKNRALPTIAKETFKEWWLRR